MNQNPKLLILGLGNPGRKYGQTRHNIGFRVADELQQENDFSDFRNSKKFHSWISRGRIKEKEIILAKPRTFMNYSGQAAKKLLAGYRLPPSRLVVVHDDIDLRFGIIRVSRNRGSAGHKGAESVIKELGTKNFIRLRLGIQPERGKPRQTELFVLKKFSPKEESSLKRILKQTCQELKSIINDC